MVIVFPGVVISLPGVVTVCAAGLLTADCCNEGATKIRTIIKVFFKNEKRFCKSVGFWREKIHMKTSYKIHITIMTEKENKDNITL